jgi:transcriptional regulator with XRE-family HTH domain
MTTPRGVTLPRRRLGTALRELREAAGLSREQVGHALDCSSSKISRIENGDVGVRRGDLAVMLGMYGVHDFERRQFLMDLARNAKSGGGWWSAFRQLLSNAELRFLELEAAAATIEGFSLAAVPGLLQIPAYAQADIQASFPGAATYQLAKRLEVRQARQALLDREQLDVRLLVDEAALHRCVGGPAVMAEQMRYLTEVGGRPGVTLQVLPFERSGRTGARSGVTLLRFADDDESATVYVDGFGGEGYVERPEEVPQATALLLRVREQALDPAESIRRIECCCLSNMDGPGWLVPPTETTQRRYGYGFGR